MTQTLQPVVNPFADLDIDRLHRRASSKWSYYPKDVLPLWVAEMDATLAPEITTAVTDALAEGDTGYPWGHACAEALAAFATDRWAWTFDPAVTHDTSDVLSGIVDAIRVLAPGDGPIVVTPPVYPPFYAIAETLGRAVVHASLSSDGRLDPATLEAALIEAGGAATSGAQPVVLLSNPHNPSGVVHTRDELAEVARLARQHGARVVSDEIHAPLMMPGVTFVPFLAVPDTGPDVAVLSASKGWNLAGFKAAVVVPGADAAKTFAATPRRAGGHAGLIDLIAHGAAFTHARPWLDAALAAIDVNRHALVELLRDHLPAVRYTPPDSTYLAWIDCRALGLGDDPAAAFLERGRVALSSGIPFGDGGAGYVRLNLATSPAILADAVARMASALAAATA